MKCAQGIEEKQERQMEKDRAAEAARQEKKRLTRRSGTGGSAASPLDVSGTTAPRKVVSSQTFGVLCEGSRSPSG